MAKGPLDKIHIRDLLVRCTLGIYPEERSKKQDVLIGVTLHTDLRAACQSDRVEDTVDYKEVKKKILAKVETSSYSLVESVAEQVAAICLEDTRIRRVEVTVDKPGALRFARSVAVEIVREQKTQL